jgi:hypothetical protein
LRCIGPKVPELHLGLVMLQRPVRLDGASIVVDGAVAA